MAAGVTLVDPATTYVDADVEVGPDTVIHPGVSPRGLRRESGAACEIHAGVRIVNSTVGDRVTRPEPLRHRGLDASDEGCSVGPFAHLRPGDACSATRRARRQLRRAEEDRPRRRRPRPTISRTSATPPSATTLEHRRRHHHLQLRRRAQASDRRSARARSSAATRTLVAPVTIGDGAYVGRRLGDHRGRPGRCAGHGPRAPGEQAWLGHSQESEEREVKAEQRKRNVRHHRLHRLQARRPRHPRRPQAARVSRLRLGGHRRRRRTATSRSAAAPASSSNLEQSLAKTPARRAVRPRPHALGHARPAHRGERASAS